jgi:hypothetical protein
VLLLPVVFDSIEPAPTAVLDDAVLEVSVSAPTAVFDPVVVWVCRALAPIAVLFAPLVVAVIACTPTAVLLLDAEVTITAKALAPTAVFRTAPAKLGAAIVLYPTAVLLAPVVIFCMDNAPNAVLLEPVVLDSIVSAPRDALLAPVVLDASDKTPTAVSDDAVEFLRAPAPMAVLLVPPTTVRSD